MKRASKGWIPDLESSPLSISHHCLTQLKLHLFRIYHSIFKVFVIPKTAATSLSVIIFLTISITKERIVTFWGKPTSYLSTFRTASTKKILDSNFIHLDFRFYIVFHFSLVFI